MENSTEIQKETWHKPEVTRIAVNLDTGLQSGSFPDGNGSTSNVISLG